MFKNLLSTAMNVGFKALPQKTTMGGGAVIVTDLAEKLMNVPVGGFLAHMGSMSYGHILLDFAPIAMGFMFVFFNERKVVQNRVK